MAQVQRLGTGSGGYEYNYSPVETLRFAADEWLDGAGLERLLDRIRPQGRSGDVYARLIASAADGAAPEEDGEPPRLRTRASR